MRKLGYGTVAESAANEPSGETRESRPGGTSPTASTTDEVEDRMAVLSKDVVFDVLKNERRRLVLEFLRERGAATLPDVAEHVAALENGKEVERLTPSERKRVYVGLYQCHVPKLADAGVVDYDEERKAIELREASSHLFPYLDLDHGAARGGGSSGRGLADHLRSVRSFLGRR